jgi:ABC-type Fe3+/spermidine/putrescine transport system ATPase subunit
MNIERLSFSYEDFFLNTSLEIKTGEFHSILGPSGSGKTTLLRIIAGFQKPETGRLTLNERDITGIPTSRRNIGMVFQDYALFPHLNVYNNIAYGLKTCRMESGKIKSRVSKLLEIVELSGYEQRKIHELSGGEKQRIALARAIAPEPELLLFDEPLSALDVKLRKILRREIKRIQQELGFTAVYVTHDQEEAMSISDRISVMNNGAVTQTGTPEELYNNPVDYFTADFIGIMNRVNGSMFRPEACSLTPVKSGEKVQMTVSGTEYTGGRYLCEGYNENKDLITFYSPKNIKKDSIITLYIDADGIKTCN